MKNKLNVLFNAEFSQSSSGYAKLAREMMSRLHSSGKYNLFELAGYCDPDDERIDNVPWKVYPTLPAANASREQLNEFHSHSENPAGRWKFNDCLLDCEPDVVLTYRDAWYESYVHYFPFRHLYHLIWHNPVDGEPLEASWIGAAVEADSCFTYTDWGYNVLKEACGTKGNIVNSLPLGVNEKDFYPIFDKGGVKRHFGFNPEALITGFVARNQPRKLIGSVIQAFTEFLLNASPSIKARSFLYLHTSWPDYSWNIPQLLKDYGVGNRVLFTYQCKNCKAVYPTVYSDIGSVCKECGRNSAATARSSEGVTEADMNMLYNFMDVYVQVSTNEGLGIPPVEAIACGVPTLVGDYSGTCEIIKYADAIPIKSGELIREMESGSNRYISVPDIQLLAKQLNELYELPTDLRRSIGNKQRLKGKDRFSWDLAAKILMEHLDTLPKKDWRSGPVRIHQPNMNLPNEISCEEAVHFMCNHVIGRPELFNRYNSLKTAYSLMMNSRGSKPNFDVFSIDDAMKDALADNRFYNNWEMKRAHKFGIKVD